MTKNLYMENIGKKAVGAHASINNISILKKNSVLQTFRNYIKKNTKLILKANKKDLLAAKNNSINRLELNNKKISGMIKSIEEIIRFKDPIGKTLASWKRPNGLSIKKITIPIGVIGIIYESRPNVTSDVSALCFKTGNPVILRGGSEAYYSNKILVSLFRKALVKNNCNINCVQFIEKKGRNNVDYLK